jgi:hypothetical protein
VNRRTGPPPCIVCGVTAREGLLCYACARRSRRDRQTWAAAATVRQRDRQRKQQLVELERSRNGQLYLAGGET